MTTMRGIIAGTLTLMGMVAALVFLISVVVWMWPYLLLLGLIIGALVAYHHHKDRPRREEAARRYAAKQRQHTEYIRSLGFTYR